VKFPSARVKRTRAVFVEVGEPWRTKAGIFAVYSSCLDANLRWFVDLKFMCVLQFSAPKILSNRISLFGSMQNGKP
jgi:hypothetical protein